MRLRFAPFLFGVLLASSVGGVAMAQTATLTVSPLVDNIRKRGTSGTAGVNRQDCLDDLTLGFNLSLVGTTTTYELQVWAGEGDCSADANRIGANAICKPVAPSLRPTTQSFKVPVRVQDLVSDLEIRPKPTTYSAAGKAACDAQSSPNARTLPVYFMLFNGATVVTSQTYKTAAGTTTGTGTTGSTAGQQNGITVDMKGPLAVTGVRASSGDRRLGLEWTGGSDTDVRGYVFYCQPRDQAPVDASATSTIDECPDANTNGEADADLGDGAVADAGEDASSGSSAVDACTPATTSGGTCPAPAVSAATECGRVIQRTNTGFTDRVLTNGVEYSLAVAPLDAFDNVGTIASVSECFAPEAVNDFWKLYNDSGGNAGGFCALEAVGLPAGSNAALVAFAIAGLAAARRGRRKH